VASDLHAQVDVAAVGADAREADSLAVGHPGGIAHLDAPAVELDQPLGAAGDLFEVTSASAS
jgi:hypothetical protein